MTITTYATVMDRRKSYSVNLKPSKTIPDQSMSIQEIITRYAKGLPISGNASEPIYEGDNSVLPINFNSLDLVEQKEIITQLRKKMTDVNEKLAKKKADAVQAAKEAAFEKAIQERLQKMNKGSDSDKPTAGV